MRLRLFVVGIYRKPAGAVRPAWTVCGVTESALDGLKIAAQHADLPEGGVIALYRWSLMGGPVEIFALRAEGPEYPAGVDTLGMDDVDLEPLIVAAITQALDRLPHPGLTKQAFA